LAPGIDAHGPVAWPKMLTPTPIMTSPTKH